MFLRDARITDAATSLSKAKMLDQPLGAAFQAARDEFRAVAQTGAVLRKPGTKPAAPRGLGRTLKDFIEAVDRKVAAFTTAEAAAAFCKMEAAWVALVTAQHSLAPAFLNTERDAGELWERAVRVARA